MEARLWRYLVPLEPDFFGWVLRQKARQILLLIEMVVLLIKTIYRSKKANGFRV